MKRELFDVNGRMGSPSRSSAEFRDSAELLYWLDSLGVARSLVWHIAARDANPTWGNRQLLEEFRKDPNIKNRLIPALVIAPTLRWEQGGLAEIKNLMTRHLIRALRIFPSDLGHSLAQLELVINELRELQPVLFIDSRTVSSGDSICDFAKRVSGIPIVYTNVAWSQLSGAFDLLARHENTYIDTSWLHICGAIEKVVEEFGMHRAVFGLGHKTNNGASIADLEDAAISDEAKERIGHRNLEEILGISSSDHGQRSNAKGYLWNRLQEGRAIDIGVIDAHGHLGPCGKWMLHSQQIESQIDDILPRMARLGIGKMIVSGTHALFGDPVFGNAYLEEAAQRDGHPFLGYLVFNPHYHEEITSTFALHFSREFFVGFKLLSSYWQVPVTDDRYEAVWRYANLHRLPILIHTWDDPYDFPSLLESIVARTPDAVFILGHTGGVDAGQKAAVELALKYQNVYLEWCGSYQMTLPFEDVIGRVGSDRILFGTDATLHSPAWELGRFLSLNLPDEQLIPALGANMRRILAMRQ